MEALSSTLRPLSFPGVFQTLQELRMPLKVQTGVQYLWESFRSWDFFGSGLDGSTGNVPLKTLLVCHQQGHLWESQAILCLVSFSWGKAPAHLRQCTHDNQRVIPLRSSFPGEPPGLRHRAWVTPKQTQHWTVSPVRDDGLSIEV